MVTDTFGPAHPVTASAGLLHDAPATGQVPRSAPAQLQSCARRWVRLMTSLSTELSNPNSALRMRSSKAAVQWSGMAAAPTNAPAIEPAVAPLLSVSRPDATIWPIAVVKSSPHVRIAAPTAAALFTV